ncbi:hypothetical protein D9M68_747130 [compost metagenome]
MGIGKRAFKLGNPALDKALALASCIVLGVFRQIALRARLGDGVNHGGTFHGFQPLELFLQALGPAHGQRNGRHVVSQTKVENAPDGAFSVKVAELARACRRKYQ